MSSGGMVKRSGAMLKTEVHLIAKSPQNRSASDVLWADGREYALSVSLGFIAWTGSKERGK
jgi:hypothetical protein